MRLEMDNVRKSSVYRIKVRGAVPESWSERLQGMNIVVDSSAENGINGSVTTLEGPLRDQAALSGVLNTLYEMHYSVLSVIRVEESEEAKE
jgi:hypothetical protein